MRRARWALAVVLAVVIVARVATRGKHSAREFGRVPDFSLTDQDGKTVRLADLSGRPWLGAFIFTTCHGQCPMMTAEMLKLARRLPALRMVSFSVDPKDAPADLKHFAAAYGARWTFLTGPEGAVRKLSREGFKLAAEDGGPVEEPIIHSNRLVLVDSSGRIRGYFDPADPADADRLVSAFSGL